MKKLTKVVMSSAVVAALGASMAFGFTGCGNGGLEITIEGSTSMEDVMNALAEKFSEKYEEENGVSVTIQPAYTGSGSGITAAAEGRVEIGISSRALKTDDAVEKTLQSQVLCLDGISVVVNKNAALGQEGVSKTDLVNIYTVAGTNLGSVVAALRRESGSGTRDGFQSALKIDDEDLITSQGFDEFTSTGALKTAIADNDAGTMIGYISMASVDDTVVALPYDDEDPDNGTGYIDATPENVVNGSYGLSRPFVICYKNYDDLSDVAKEFIEFMMSEEGQKICEEEGGISEILAEAK